MVEKDIGDLGRRDLRSKKVSCEPTISICNDKEKLATGSSL